MSSDIDSDREDLFQILTARTTSTVDEDDPLVHDRGLRAVLRCLQESGLTLNDKCEVSKPSIRLLAHIIDGSGLHAHPLKTSAIAQFP